MGPLEEWGPGKTAPVAPPLGGPDYLDGLINMKGKNFTNSQEHLVPTYNSRLFNKLAMLCIYTHKSY